MERGRGQIYWETNAYCQLSEWLFTVYWDVAVFPGPLKELTHLASVIQQRTMDGWWEGCSYVWGQIGFSELSPECWEAAHPVKTREMSISGGENHQNRGSQRAMSLRCLGGGGGQHVWAQRWEGMRGEAGVTGGQVTEGIWGSGKKFPWENMSDMWVSFTSAPAWDIIEGLIVLVSIGEGNGNPLQCSCLENPRDRGAWWAAIYGVAQSQTRLKWLRSSSRVKTTTTTTTTGAWMKISFKLSHQKHALPELRRV